MNKNFKINKLVFWPPFLSLLAIVALSFINVDAFTSVVNGATMFLVDWMGFLIGPITSILVIILTVVLFHPISKTVIGGKDAKPEFKTWIGQIEVNAIFSALFNNIGILVISWMINKTFFVSINY